MGELSTDPLDWLSAGDAVKDAQEALLQAAEAVGKVVPARYARRLWHTLAPRLRSGLEDEMYRRLGREVMARFEEPLLVFFASTAVLLLAPRGRRLSKEPSDWLTAGEACKQAVRAVNRAWVVVCKVVPASYSDTFRGVAGRVSEMNCQLRDEMYRRLGEAKVGSAFENPDHVFCGEEPAKLR